NNDRKMKKLVAGVQRGDNERTFWTNIGVAFENADGSWNLKFNLLPTSPNTTIQLRDIDPKADE
ncbi:MAG TPA: hypothetical protein VFG30_14290, partial [Polyangiales bacterium]|nr:hypothetical protein [Polyangiales bacterium]